MFNQNLFHIAENLIHGIMDISIEQALDLAALVQEDPIDLIFF